ncbi:MAG: NAD(P)H-dependent oxidoreductase subunit E [Candidatus Diapherotrites archaeon]|nr:NAD(P)H-dependent oxidoreductase subunit E [Candidatus Micrarchaeota archaeon]
MPAEWLEKEIKTYKKMRSPLIPLLHELRRREGVLSKENLIFISRGLDVPLSHIYEAATFYTEFNLNPKGKNVLRVCTGTSCSVKGGSINLRLIEKALGIKPGETTKDKKFTLETVNCFGACSMAPVAEINGTLYTNLSTDKLNKLLAKLGAGSKGVKK